MRQILFVDDQPEVLHGIERMLFDRCDEWQMAFADGGKTALQLMEDNPYDVVVSDMRMPGMDGADLLNEVARRQPFIVRIILSGYSEREMVMKSVRATHQFLAKPLDSRRFQHILERAFELRHLLTHEKLKGIITSMKTLPSLPTVYYELMRELQNPDITMTKIGQLIAKDVGMTAKLMQLVNSSFFGLPVHISDPVHAAKLLGADVIKGLVLSVQVFAQFDKLALSGFSLERFTEHSLAVASLAKIIAATVTTDKKVVDNAFIGGMLHDVGKLVLAEYKTTEYDKALAMAKEQSVAEWQAERNVIGTSHAEVGGYLLGIWGLPDEIIECAAYHHHPGNFADTNITPMTAVHLANALETDLPLQHHDAFGSAIDMEYLRELNLESKLPEWQNIHKDKREARS
jgi:putative nucleotidyltransferase with HDIG domain